LLHATPLVNVLVTLCAVVLPPYVTDFVPLKAQYPCSVAHFVKAVDVEPDELDVPVPYQQVFWYPYAGSIGDTVPFEHFTPFVKGPLTSYISEGEVVPNTTFALPVKEQS
jgi:hypothetical protein